MQNRFSITVGCRAGTGERSGDGDSQGGGGGRAEEPGYFICIHCRNSAGFGIFSRIL